MCDMRPGYDHDPHVHDVRSDCDHDPDACGVRPGCDHDLDVHGGSGASVYSDFLSFDDQPYDVDWVVLDGLHGLSVWVGGVQAQAQRTPSIKMVDCYHVFGSY